MAHEFEAMKNTMFHLSNKLMKTKLNLFGNQSHHPRQFSVQNSYSQNQSTNYSSYDNINNVNNSITSVGPSKNGYQNNEVPNQHPQIMDKKPL